MSIAELIMTGTERASKSTDWVADSLAKIGDNVGKVLREREQQKQAQEMLPFLQQSMQESMKLAQTGDTAGAYSNMMGIFASNPNLMQNKAVLPFLEMGLKGINESATRYKQGQEYNQRQAYYDKVTANKTGGGGEEDRSLYTPEERARMTLLGQTPNVTLYEDQNVISDTTAVSQPTAQGQIGMPANQVSSPTIVEVPLPQAVPTKEAPVQEEGGATEMTYKGPQVKAVESMAASIKSPEYKKALLNSIKNPAPKEQVASFKQFSEQYNSLPEDGKMAVMQDLSVVFDSDKNFEKNKPQLGKNFYPLKPEQSAIIGNNITGIILEPTTEAKSMTAGAKSDSVTFGTNKNDIDAYQTLFTSATSELSQGKLGKFLKENGGVFNTTYTETPSEVIPTMATQSGKITIPSKAVLYQKNLDPNNEKTPVIELTEGQLSAFKTIQNSPSRLQQLRAGNSNSSFVRIAPSGPIRGTDKAIPQAATAASVYKSKEDVISAIKSNKLTREQGRGILQNQFGYK
jgi:hypothetical protein